MKIIGVARKFRQIFNHRVRYGGYQKNRKAVSGKKVLYLTNVPTAYKTAFLSELGKRVNLTVLYDSIPLAARNKYVAAKTARQSFCEVFLHTIPFGPEAGFAPEAARYFIKSYDTILVGGYSSPTAILAICYMKARKISYGILCDGMLPHKEKPMIRKLKYFLLHSADYVLSSGRLTSELLQQYGVDAEKIYEFPFSSVKESEIVSAGYGKREYKEKIGCMEKQMALFAGRCLHRKGIDILLKAFKKAGCMDCRLYIVGEHAQELLQKTGPVRNVTFVEFTGKEGLADYYCAADLFVLPTREDIWGLVVNEAFAYGLPVITTKNCGAGLELIRPGYNGWLVPVGDVRTLARRMQQVLEREDMESLQKHALETARCYTVEAMAARVAEVIKMQG